METKQEEKKKFTNNRDKKGGNRGRRGRRPERPAPEFEQKILDLARVTRVMAGGKRMSFRACVAIGDKKGRVAVGVAKGVDVTIAINKAVNQAKKAMITVKPVKGTIPHQVKIKEGASQILLKPAASGSGIKAGGVVRVILELAGIPNISAKILGSNNKINNAKTTIKALSDFKKVPKSAAPKKKTVKKAAAKKTTAKKAAPATKKATTKKAEK